ncbi:hypothetical protein [Methylobacterium sp.]|uniref:hypothetical protein n=1 Tax=Methylobacterium sp. TaxID=409 RepID=UPI003B0280E2
MSAKMIITALVFGLIVATMIVGACAISNDVTERFINIGIFCAAIASGAIVGTALAPFDKREEEKFGNYSKAIGLFASGYIASKANKIIDKLFDPATYVDISQLTSFRLIAAIAVALAASKLTFAFRSYGYRSR